MLDFLYCHRRRSRHDREDRGYRRRYRDGWYPDMIADHTEQYRYPIPVELSRVRAIRRGFIDESSGSERWELISFRGWSRYYFTWTGSDDITVANCTSSFLYSSCMLVRIERTIRSSYVCTVSFRDFSIANQSSPSVMIPSWKACSMTSLGPLIHSYPRKRNRSWSTFHASSKVYSNRCMIPSCSRREIGEFLHASSRRERAFL